MFARPDRLLADKAIFEARRKGQAGTVLLDASQSMKLSFEAIYTLVSEMPAGTIAYYNGEEKKGTLYIAGNKGMVIARNALEMHGPWNIVDVPALRWLAGMPGPRVWVSDGKVHGTDGEYHPALTTATRLLCRQAEIRQVQTIPEALKHARTGFRSIPPSLSINSRS